MKGKQFYSSFRRTVLTKNTSLLSIATTAQIHRAETVTLTTVNPKKKEYKHK